MKRIALSFLISFLVVGCETIHNTPSNSEPTMSTPKNQSTFSSPTPEVKVPTQEIPKEQASSTPIDLSGIGYGTIVTYSPDGKYLAMGFEDGIVIFDAHTLRAIKLIRNNDNVLFVLFSPDSRFLISNGMEEGEIGFWSVNDWSLVKVMQITAFNVGAAAISPDGKMLATNNREGHEIRLWNISDGVKIGELNGHSMGVICLAFSPNGKKLASGSGDYTVRIWDLTDGSQLLKLGQEVGGISDSDWSWVESIAFSPDGNTLVSANSGGVIRVWRVTDGALLKTVDENFEVTKSMKVVFSPDGTMLVYTIRTKDTIRVRDSSTMEELLTLTGFSDDVLDIAYRPDGNELASVSWDGTLRTWKMPQGSPLETINLK